MLLRRNAIVVSIPTCVRLVRLGCWLDSCLPFGTGLSKPWLPRTFFLVRSTHFFDFEGAYGLRRRSHSHTLHVIASTCIRTEGLVFARKVRTLYQFGHTNGAPASFSG